MDRGFSLLSIAWILIDWHFGHTILSDSKYVSMLSSTTLAAISDGFGAPTEASSGAGSGTWVWDSPEQLHFSSAPLRYAVKSSWWSEKRKILKKKRGLR